MHKFITVLILIFATTFQADAGNILEIRVKTGTSSDAGCDCDLEVAVITPIV